MQSRASTSSLDPCQRFLLNPARLLPIRISLLRQLRRRLASIPHLILAFLDRRRHRSHLLNRLCRLRVLLRIQHRLPNLGPRSEVVTSVTLKNGKDDLLEGVGKLGVLGESATEEFGDSGRRIVESLIGRQGSARPFLEKQTD